MLSQEYLGKDSPKCFPEEPFFRVFHIKCLSKCTYFKEPPPPLKCPGCMPEGLLHRINAHAWKLLNSIQKIDLTIKNCNIQNIFILRTLAACFCCYYFNIFTRKFKEDIERNFFFFVKCLKQIKVFTQINFRKNSFCVKLFSQLFKFQ